MIEIEIPKDIRKYEAKLVGPLTTRQTICSIIMAVTAIITFKVLGEMPKDVKFFVLMIVVLPSILIGFVKPYGMPFEKFAQTAFVSNFLSPKYRKYVTNNFYSDGKSKNIKINRKQDLKKSRKRKQDKNFVAYS